MHVWLEATLSACRLPASREVSHGPGQRGLFLKLAIWNISDICFRTIFSARTLRFAYAFLALPPSTEPLPMHQFSGQAKSAGSWLAAIFQTRQCL
jgi:hypothetical protein